MAVYHRCVYTWVKQVRVSTRRQNLYNSFYVFRAVFMFCVVHTDVMKQVAYPLKEFKVSERNEIHKRRKVGVGGQCKTKRSPYKFHLKTFKF